MLELASLRACRAYSTSQTCGLSAVEDKPTLHPMTVLSNDIRRCSLVGGSCSNTSLKLTPLISLAGPVRVILSHRSIWPCSSRGITNITVILSLRLLRELAYHLPFFVYELRTLPMDESWRPEFVRDGPACWLALSAYIVCLHSLTPSMQPPSGTGCRFRSTITSFGDMTANP